MSPEIMRGLAIQQGSRWVASRRKMSLWILDSGTASLLDLFRQPPSFDVALNS
jgi:hypothetical protein